MVSLASQGGSFFHFLVLDNIATCLILRLVSFHHFKIFVFVPREGGYFLLCNAFTTKTESVSRLFSKSVIGITLSCLGHECPC